MTNIQYALLIGFVIVTGCAQTLQIPPPTPFEPLAAAPDVKNPEYDWWQYTFKLTWPEDDGPDFSRHLLIADKIFAPALAAHQEHIPLWRFHRRAGRDKAGHRLSLILYTDSATAEAFNHSVSSNLLTSWLTERNMIEKTGFHPRSPQEMGQLELTSDPNWPMEIQRSWPYFIMGVSQAWLMLVQEHSAEGMPTGNVDYTELLAHYQTVDQRVNTQWRENGQHAYLHHISAIFGYQPIRIRSSELTTF
jgi:hypothetical protein